MRIRCLLLVLLTTTLATTDIVRAREKEALAEYQSRRESLRARVNGVVVLFGYTGDEEISPAETFRQEENFYYLTGHNQPGAALILIPDSPEARARNFPKEILLLPPRNKPRERWEGPKLGPDDPDARAQTGFETVLPTAQLRPKLEEFLAVFPSLYTLFPVDNPEYGPGGEASHAGWWFA
ncbi:MAG: aminopeptidase P N-terminal domain-containing protein, partial [Acidobacteria bacterium]|nr:aminopeptidase P N-terminal domain-containing protein [Acidobacteriota bacterium]